MTANIDENAPVFTSQSIEINAPIETVWATISDIAHWPEWNPEIRDVEIDGPLATGTNFKWKAGPGTIRSTLRTLSLHVRRGGTSAVGQLREERASRHHHPRSTGASQRH